MTCYAVISFEGDSVGLINKLAGIVTDPEVKLDFVLTNEVIGEFVKTLISSISESNTDATKS